MTLHYGLQHLMNSKEVFKVFRATLKEIISTWHLTGPSGFLGWKEPDENSSELLPSSSARLLNPTQTKADALPVTK